MASRYWVGGTDTWDATAGTKWALTTGGAGGQAVPTSSDTVFFDANSGASTVTIGAGTAICSTLTMTGFTGTLAFGSNSIDLAGTGTITVYTGATTFSVTGTPLMLVTGNTASTRTINSGAVTEANSISFDISVGSGLITVSTNTSVKNIVFSGTFTGSLGNSTRTIYGNLTLKTGMTVTAGAGTNTFAATSGTQTITSAALNLDFPITINAIGATVRLVDDLSVGTATSRTITLTNGTLDLNDKTLTNFGAFNSSGSVVRSIAFGATGSYTNTYSLGTATIFNVATATNFSITGTPTINVTGNATTGTRRLDYGNTVAPASPEANSLSFYITAGSDSIQITGTTYTRNLDFTGSFTGTLTNSTRSIYGNYTLNPNMTVAAGGLTTSFLSTAGTQLITTAGQIVDIPITINAVGAGVQLVDNLTIGVTRTFTLTAGTVDLNNKTLSTGVFFTNTTLVREIIFGNDSVNGIIKITGFSTAGNTTLVFRADGVTGLTLTGYPQVILDSTLGDPTGIRSIAGGLSSTEARRFFFNVINGTDIVSVAGTRDYRTIDFTGFGGTLQTTGSNLTNLAGGLIFSSAMTVGTLAFGFTFSSGYGASFTASQSGFNLTVSSVTGVLGAGCTVSDASNNNIGRILSQTSGTTGGAGVYVLDTGATIASQAMTSFWKIDTQNKSIGASISFTTVGSSWKLQSPLTITGQLGLTSGTFNSNSQNITAGNLSAAASGTKTLNISNSTFTVTGGSSTTGFIVISGGTTYNLTGCNIVFTTSEVTSFYASGGTPTTVTMAGTGQLIIGASGTTQNIGTLTNTVQPCTISLLSNILRLFVTNFNLSGTAGNLVTFNSSVAGTAVNIRKTSGTVNAQYMYIQDSVADGGAEWRATNSWNAGNNTGWFIVSPISVRLKNDGTLLTDGSLQFDEMDQNKFSINPMNNKVYSGFFDEVIIPVGAMRTANTGITSVSGTFDEVTGIQ